MFVLDLCFYGKKENNGQIRKKTYPESDLTVWAIGF